MQVFELAGDYSEGETPVPIPNTEVKPFCADGTAWETLWESRTLPASFFNISNQKIEYKYFHQIYDSIYRGVLL